MRLFLVNTFAINPYFHYFCAQLSINIIIYGIIHQETLCCPRSGGQ